MFLQNQPLFPASCETQVISSEESPRGQTGFWLMSSAQSAAGSPDLSGQGRTVNETGLEAVTNWSVLLRMGQKINKKRKKEKKKEEDNSIQFSCLFKT